MLKISQNVGRFANQLRQTNHYQYLTSQILSQSRCGTPIDTTATRLTQASTNDADACGCAIRLKQRVGLCQLGRTNSEQQNGNGAPPLKSSCLWVVDKATPWFKEQREQMSFNNTLPSLSDRCKLLGITSTRQAAHAQILAMQKPILMAQEQRLDPNKFKHISPEFLSVLREHDNLCLQKNPFYGMPKDKVRKKPTSPSSPSLAAKPSADQLSDRGTTMCSSMKPAPAKRRSKCMLSSYLAAKKRKKQCLKREDKSQASEPHRMKCAPSKCHSKCMLSRYLSTKKRKKTCSYEREDKSQAGEPHASSYNRLRNASGILKGFSASCPNAYRRSRKDRYADETHWRDLNKPSGPFRHSTHINARRQVRISQSREDELPESGFHRHPIQHLQQVQRCDSSTPYFNRTSQSCSSLRSSRSSMRTSSQNLGFHRRTYLHCFEDTSTKKDLMQPGSVNRTWDYGSTHVGVKTPKGLYRHSYASISPIDRWRSHSRPRCRAKSKSPPRRPYQSPYRDPSRSAPQSLCSSKSSLRSSKSSLRSSKSTDDRVGRRRNNQPVRQIYMKPKAAEMRESRSRCCLKRSSKERGLKAQDSAGRGSKRRDKNDCNESKRSSCRCCLRRSSRDRGLKERGSKDRGVQRHGSNERSDSKRSSSRCCLRRGSRESGSKDRGVHRRDSPGRNDSRRGSTGCCGRRKSKEQDLATCCREPPKKKRSFSRCCLRRSSSKKRQPQVKFNSRSNQYYKEPHMHAYNATITPAKGRCNHGKGCSGSSSDTDISYKGGKRGKDGKDGGSRSSICGSNKKNDKSKKKNKDKDKDKEQQQDAKKGKACRRKRSDTEMQTDDDLCYPPLRITKTQKKRMMEEALKRFVPEPEDESASAGKGKGKGGADDDSADGRKGSSASVSRDENGNVIVKSQGLYGDKWPSRTASFAPLLPMATKKCGRRLVRDPAAPPKPKVQRKKSWSSCMSSDESQQSSVMTPEEQRANANAYKSRRRMEPLLRRHSEQYDSDKGRRRRKTALLVGVERKHHICHKDSTDWTATTKQYPNHLRRTGMEQRCEQLVNCKHRCTTKGLLDQEVSRDEWMQRQKRHKVCDYDSASWMHINANYPPSYQRARCKERAYANMLRHHYDRTEQILTFGYSPHKQAREAKAKRMDRKHEERATPKCNHKPKQYPLRPAFYAPKRDFSRDWEALNKHEQCLPPVRRLQLFQQQHEQEEACKRSASEGSEGRPSARRRPAYDPGKENVQRRLRDEEEKRCERKHVNHYFLETDDEYYREAEEEARKRKEKPKTKPCKRWGGKQPSVTLVCTPEADEPYKHRPKPSPKPPKKYNYDHIDDDEYRRLRHARRERKWFDEDDPPVVVRCLNDRAEKRCVRRERTPKAPCQSKPDYILGKSNYDKST